MLLVVLLAMGMPGCSVCRDFQRTMLKEPAEFSWKLDRRRSVKMYREWADEAWKTCCAGCGVSPDGITQEYEAGFRDGFVEYVYAGGTGEPPPAPPRKFWNAGFRDEEGRAAAQFWFKGYRHGASVARDGGYRDRVILAAHLPAGCTDGCGNGCNSSCALEGPSGGVGGTGPLLPSSPPVLLRPRGPLEGEILPPAVTAPSEPLSLPSEPLTPSTEASDEGIGAGALAPSTGTPAARDIAPMPPMAMPLPTAPVPATPVPATPAPRRPVPSPAVPDIELPSEPIPSTEPGISPDSPVSPATPNEGPPPRKSDEPEDLEDLFGGWGTRGSSASGTTIRLTRTGMSPPTRPASNATEYLVDRPGLISAAPGRRQDAPPLPNATPAPRAAQPAAGRPGTSIGGLGFVR
jgi:hypothetical protein